MNEYHELEYKYNANGILLRDFQALMARTGFDKELTVSSWDIYYTKSQSDKFLRYRESDSPELTQKIKTSDKNNWTRVEVDLPLDPRRITPDVVDKFTGLMGYRENFRIYKSCFIFWKGEINYVYYIVFDENLEEKGRFIEVEVNKEKVPELGGVGALACLKEGEQKLLELGINPQNRLKKSLFEIFVK